MMGMASSRLQYGLPPSIVAMHTCRSEKAKWKMIPYHPITFRRRTELTDARLMLLSSLRRDERLEASCKGKEKGRSDADVGEEAGAGGPAGFAPFLVACRVRARLSNGNGGPLSPAHL